MNSEVDKDYGIIRDAAIGIKDGNIAWCGSAADFPEFDSLQTPIVNGGGKWITPSFIDCHSHIVFAGSRANEFEMRLNGASYQDIAAQGGGIISTVNATRDADHETLFVAAKDRLNALLNEGVTTVEIKSGYGLDIDSEIKMLEVAEQLKPTSPYRRSKNFLGCTRVTTGI